MTFSLRTLLAAASLSGLLLLASCGNFFFDPNGTGGNATCSTNCVYIANSGTDDIAAFADTNPLTAVSSVNVGIMDVAISMAVTPDNNFLFAGSSIGNIYSLPIESGGSLGSPTTAQALPDEEIRALAVDPSGTYLLAAIAVPITSSSCTIGYYGITQIFTINSDGSLTAGSVPTNGPCGIPTSIAISANSQYIFMGVGTGGMQGYSFSGGTATPQAGLSISASTTTQINGVAVDPQSTYLFVSASGTSGGIAEFQISSSSGNYSLKQEATTQDSGGALYPVAVDTKAAYVYTADYTTGEIYGYTYSSGGLTAISGSPFSPSSSAEGVNGLAVDGSGSYVLTVNQSGPNLQQFTIGASGALTASSTGTTSSGSYYPSALAITQ